MLFSFLRYLFFKVRGTLDTKYDQGVAYPKIMPYTAMMNVTK